jgi:hypothetical protein
MSLRWPSHSKRSESELLRSFKREGLSGWPSGVTAAAMKMDLLVSLRSPGFSQLSIQVSHLHPFQYSLIVVQIKSSDNFQVFCKVMHEAGRKGCHRWILYQNIASNVKGAADAIIREWSTFTP